MSNEKGPKIATVQGHSHKRKTLHHIQTVRLLHIQEPMETPKRPATRITPSTLHIDRRWQKETKLGYKLGPYRPQRDAGERKTTSAEGSCLGLSGMIRGQDWMLWLKYTALASSHWETPLTYVREEPGKADWAILEGVAAGSNIKTPQWTREESCRGQTMKIM